MFSVVVPVMNRTDRIVPCLSTWIDNPLVGEVVLVDWSSDVPVFTDDSVSEIVHHPKTRVVRVNGEDSFICMSFSLNVGVFRATMDHVVKIDIDYKLVNDQLLETFNRSRGTRSFYCGTIPRKYDFHGFSFFPREDFVAINGYNERIRGWGFDDEDFYRRMEKRGLERIVIMNIEQFLYHIPHNDAMRTANYPQKDKHETNRSNERIIKEYDCGCLSTYTTLCETRKYTELVRVR